MELVEGRQLSAMEESPEQAICIPSEAKAHNT
jgi:hypothetical protein